MKSAEILMVSEGLPVMSLIAGALEFQGHRVTVTNNARISTAGLGRKNYDLIIFKWSRGPEATTILKRMNLQTKLIILSEEQKLPVEAYRVQVEDYIFLPCRPPEIWKRIAESLQRLEFRPLPRETTNHLYPVNRRIYRQLVSMFNEMRTFILSMSSFMQLLQQKVRCQNDQKLENLCQQAYESNLELLGIMRELEEPFVNISPKSPLR
jgi:DNA-binding response OmpR family regulator